MPYRSIRELPDAVKDALPAEAQRQFLRVVNAQEERGLSEERSFASAWATIKQNWRKGDDGKWHKITKTIYIDKTDALQQLVFGWANVAVRKNGEQIEDLHGDLIDPDDLESAAYLFNLSYRGMGIEHSGEIVGYLVESCCITKAKLRAWGLEEDALPLGLWVGFHIPDTASFQKVVDGDFRMFSIQGTAEPEEVDYGP